MFDNPEDSLVGQLAEAALFGVDVTDFLDHALTRSPVTLYLFHVIRSLLDGRRFVCWMDEFWRLLADPAFESFRQGWSQDLAQAECRDGARDAERERRARESASAARSSSRRRPRSSFRIPDANAAEYIEGFGLSEREFKLIKEQLEPGSRQFLVKQGHYSVVCELDLKGFDAELKVISGRASSVEALHRIMAESRTRSRAVAAGVSGIVTCEVTKESGHESSQSRL